MRTMPVALPVLLALLVLLLLGWQFRHQPLADLRSLLQIDRASVTSVILHLSFWPRFFTTLITGAALALAGVLMQQVLRNPLASPSTLGVASGAGFCLMLAMLYLPAVVEFSRSLVAMAGGMIAVGLVFLLAKRSALSPAVVVVAGLVINLYTGAASTLLLMLNQEKLAGLMIWGAGSLAQTGWENVYYLLPRVVLVTLVSLLLAKPLTLLTLSDQSVKSLGVSLVKLRVVCLVLAVLLTGWVVSRVGVISFIGLLAPACARLSGVHRLLPKLVMSMLCGALLLTLADLVVQQLPVVTRAFLPTGAVTALAGSPLLLWLLPKMTGQHTHPDATLLHVAPVIRPARRYAQPVILVLLMACLILFSTVAIQNNGWVAGDLSMLEWRLPRLIAAIVTGAILAVAGTALQRLSGNPVASPEVLGISSGAALGVIFAVSVSGASGFIGMYSGGFAGALITLGIIMLINHKSGYQPDKVLLTGIAVTAFMSAVQSILLAGGDPRYYQVLAWLSGTTYYVSVQSLITLLVPAVIFTLLMMCLIRWLDLLPLGSATAQSLGVNLFRARILLLLLVAGLTVSATLVTGPVSFIGLMAPHMARLAGFGRSARQHLLSAMLIGATLMLFADWLGRQILYPQDIPAGIVASVIGGMYLMWGLRKTV